MVDEFLFMYGVLFISANIYAAANIESGFYFYLGMSMIYVGLWVWKTLKERGEKE